MAPDGKLEVGLCFDADGNAVVEVAGEVDMASAPELSMQLGEAAWLTAGRLQVDLGGVTFFGGAGVRALVKTDRRLGSTGRGLRVVNASPVVHRVLALTDTMALLG